MDVKVITIADQYDYFNNLHLPAPTPASCWAASPTIPSSYHFLTHLVEPNGYYNVFRFALPELQARIKTLPSLDTIEETRMLAEINAAFESDSLYIPLYYNSNFVAIRESHQGHRL